MNTVIKQIVPIIVLIVIGVVVCLSVNPVNSPDARDSYTCPTTGGACLPLSTRASHNEVPDATILDSTVLDRPTK